MAWTRIAWALLGIEMAVALALSAWSGEFLAPPVLGYFNLFVRVIPLVLLCGLFAMASRLRDAPSILLSLYGAVVDNRDRLVVLAGAILLFCAQFLLLSWIKPHLEMTGYWADPLLAKIDRTMFGADPWVGAHWLAGHENQAIDLIYVSWFPAVMGVYAVIALSNESRARSKCLASFFLVVAVSIALQFMLPSGGPVFFERMGFGDQFASLESLIPEMATKGADYLWLARDGSDEAIGGISAMPSVHVALAAWALIAALAFRRMILLAAAYLALILFGSIYLGWHYASDGIVGIAIAWASHAAVANISGVQLGSFPRLWWRHLAERVARLFGGQALR